MSEHTDPHHIGTDTDGIANKLTSARLYAHEIEAGRRITDAQALATRRMVNELRDELDRIEAATNIALRLNDHTWEEIAEMTGYTSKQAAYQRNSRITRQHLYLVSRKPDAFADPEFLALYESREDAQDKADAYNARFGHESSDPYRATVRRVHPRFVDEHTSAPAVTPASR